MEKFNKNDLQELDLVLSRDNILYWVLNSKFHNSMGLFTFDLNPICMLNSYSDDLKHCNDSNKDIIGVIRGDTKWYNLTRMREFEESEKRGEAFITYSKNWKWLYKEKEKIVVSTKKFENMIFFSSDLKLSKAKQYVYTGKQIKDEISKLMEADLIAYNEMYEVELKTFIDHYILDKDYILSDNKEYIMFRGKEHIVCKKWDRGEYY